MFPLPQAHTADLSLTAVIDRLSQHQLVIGLVTVGTTGRATLKPWSDYDLLVILDEELLPLHVGITFIDHRLTDLLFATSQHLHAILSAEQPINANQWHGRLARWLEAGQIVFDRHGQLQVAQTKIKAGGWIQPLQPIDSYGAWIGVNYNLMHTRRMCQADDPVYQAAAELRITLYGIPSLVYSYFQVRQLHWEGDKWAMRYLMEHDPAFLGLLQQILREADLQRKMALYDTMATLTLAPLAPLWHGEPTVIWSDSHQPTIAQIEQALAFWDELIGAE